MYTNFFNSPFFEHFSISSSLKPAPGMSPGIRSTWWSAVLVVLNFPQGQKAHFHATSGFFLTCDQQVSFFLESENCRISLFFWAPFSPRNLSCKSESNAINTGLLLGTKLLFVPNHRLKATSSSVLQSSVYSNVQCFLSFYSNVHITFSYLVVFLNFNSSCLFY